MVTNYCISGHAVHCLVLQQWHLIFWPYNRRVYTVIASLDGRRHERTDMHRHLHHRRATACCRWTAALVALHWAISSSAEASVIRVLAFPKPPPESTSLGPEPAEPEAPDMMECLRAMSYTCVQRKTAVYLDALNRLDRIRLLGDFVTAVRTRPVRSRSPAISERLLDARGLNNVVSLSVLVNAVVGDIVQDHVLKISFPRIVDLGLPYGLSAVAGTDDDDRTEVSTGGDPDVDE
ncbi:hypothetical protein ACI65C_001204 [Semiaphis heraclei]